MHLNSWSSCAGFLPGDLEPGGGVAGDAVVVPPLTSTAEAPVQVFPPGGSGKLWTFLCVPLPAVPAVVLPTMAGPAPAGKDRFFSQAGFLYECRGGYPPVK